MNLLLIGYGKMGKVIERLAGERGHRIVAAVDPFAARASQNTETGGPLVPAMPVYADFAALDAWLAEHPAVKNEGLAALEFTSPSTAAANVIALAERGIPTVCGSTGWYGQLPQVTAAVEKAGSALVYASNFSLGVNLFYRVCFYAAELFDRFGEYDAAGFEAHHNKKADSPSGTAKTLAEGVLKRMTRKTKAVYDTLDRPPAADELHFPSLRLGSVPGVHSLLFDSAADTVEIRHTARGREGLASGALLAAEWLASPDKNGRPRRGVYLFEEALEEIINT